MFEDLKSTLINDDVKATIESMIHPQLDDPFTKQLIELIEDRYRIGRNNFKKELAKLLSKRFNIKFNITYSEGFASFTLAMIGSSIGDLPDDSNLLNVLSMELRVGSGKLLDEIERIRNSDIVVDLKRAKIYGLKTDYTYVFLDNDMFDKKYDLTAREIAAILLHEVGHIFTHIYYSAFIVKNTFNLIESLILYSNGEVAKAKKLILTQNNDKNKDYEVIFKRDLETLKDVMDEYHGRLLGMQGGDTLNKISEIEADDFATKFGLGDALASSLRKLMVDNAWSYRAKELVWLTVFISVLVFINLLMSGIISIIVLINTTGFLVLMILLFMILFSFIFKILLSLGIVSDVFRYPKLKERLDKVKRSIIKMFRTYDLSKKDIDVLVKQIDNIEKEMKIIDERFINTNIGSILMTDIYNFGSIEDINTLYETIADKLANNDFHYLAEKVKRIDEQ